MAPLRSLATIGHFADIRTMAAGLLAAFALLVTGGAARADEPAWRPCGDALGAGCARVSVPLDRTGALAGSISLRVARLPGAHDLPVLVYLSGGPGSGALAELDTVLWSLPDVTRSYEVVTFDQRGTGGSGLLRCPELERDPRLRSTAAGAACARRLGPARGHYTTADSVEDLEAVRRALGAEKLTLFGISYGTELALAYARTYPDHVARMVLDSVADPDDRDPFGLAGMRAIGPTLAALCPRGCRGVSRAPVQDLARLVPRLPMTGRVVDGSGRVRTRRLGAVAIADLLYDADYDPPLRAGIPAAVRAALHGDAAPLLRLVAVGDGMAALPSPRVFSSARYATVCEETPLPWDATTPVADRLAEARRRAAALGRAAFLPFDFDTAAADEIDLCLRWPSRAAAAAGAAGPPPYPAVPALILQGGEDLRTPPEVSARVSAGLPGAVRIVVPGVGHGVVPSDPSGCAETALTEFLAGREPARACPRVPTGVPAVAVPPRRLADVAPSSSVAGTRLLPLRVRRTAAAIGLTLDDVRFALSPAFPTRAGGGLRGGTYRDGLRGIVLRRYEAVGGVRVSGRWKRGRLRLRVGGPAATRGAVAISRSGRLRGVLGGRRVAGRLEHRPPRPLSEGGIARASRASSFTGACCSVTRAARRSHPWPERPTRSVRTPT